jgi:predicted ATPase
MDSEHVIRFVSSSVVSSVEIPLRSTDSSIMASALKLPERTTAIFKDFGVQISVEDAQSQSQRRQDGYFGRSVPYQSRLVHHLVGSRFKDEVAMTRIYRQESCLKRESTF